MRSIAIFTVFVAVCSAQRFLVEEETFQNVRAADFATGFFLAMRAAEYCPHAFDCASQADSFKKTISEIQAKLHDHPTMTVILESIIELVTAFEEVIPGCEAVAAEGRAYIAEIKGIVSDSKFPLQAAENLFKYRHIVTQDIKDYKQAEADKQYLVAGMKLGEIGRIAIWGTPAE